MEKLKEMVILYNGKISIHRHQVNCLFNYFNIVFQLSLLVKLLYTINESLSLLSLLIFGIKNQLQTFLKYFFCPLWTTMSVK